MLCFVFPSSGLFAALAGRIQAHYKLAPLARLSSALLWRDPAGGELLPRGCILDAAERELHLEDAQRAAADEIGAPALPPRSRYWSIDLSLYHVRTLSHVPLHGACARGDSSCRLTAVLAAVCAFVGAAVYGLLMASICFAPGAVTSAVVVLVLLIPAAVHLVRTWWTARAVLAPELQDWSIRTVAGFVAVAISFFMLAPWEDGPCESFGSIAPGFVVIVLLRVGTFFTIYFWFELAVLRTDCAFVLVPRNKVPPWAAQLMGRLLAPPPPRGGGTSSIGSRGGSSSVAAVAAGVGDVSFSIPAAAAAAAAAAGSFATNATAGVDVQPLPVSNAPDLPIHVFVAPTREDRDAWMWSLTAASSAGVRGISLAGLEAMCDAIKRSGLEAALIRSGAAAAAAAAATHAAAAARAFTASSMIAPTFAVRGLQTATLGGAGASDNNRTGVGVPLSAASPPPAAPPPPEVSPSYSTGALVYGFVKPATQEARASLLDAHFQGCGSDLVGPATAFVSHAWSDSFPALVASLRAHAGRERQQDYSVDDQIASVLGGGFYKFSRSIVEIKGTSRPAQQYYWIDVAFKNQHAAVAGNASYMADTKREFFDSIGHPGRTLLVANGIFQGREPAPLSRVWCLWEAYVSVATGSTLELALLPQDDASMLSTLAELSRRGSVGGIDPTAGGTSLLTSSQETTNAISSMVLSIDLARAQATVAADRDSIFADVQATGGFEGVNAMVKLAVAHSWPNILPFEHRRKLIKWQNAAVLLVPPLIFVGTLMATESVNQEARAREYAEQACAAVPLEADWWVLSSSNVTLNPGSCFTDRTLSDAIESCCQDEGCAGFSFLPINASSPTSSPGSGCFKGFPITSERDPDADAYMGVYKSEINSVPVESSSIVAFVFEYFSAFALLALIGGLLCLAWYRHRFRGRTMSTSQREQYWRSQLLGSSATAQQQMQAAQPPKIDKYGWLPPPVGAKPLTDDSKRRIDQAIFAAIGATASTRR